MSNPLLEGLRRNKEKQAISTSDVDKFLSLFEQMVQAVNQKIDSEPEKDVQNVQTQESHA